MSEAIPMPAEAPTGPAHPVRVFLTANFVYLWVVHFWALSLAPLRADVGLLADPSALPLLGRVSLALLHGLFGAGAGACLQVNIFLLYGCMVGTFFLTRAVLDSRWWLGSLVAVLMMANPLKSEAVLSVAGAQHLVPALCAIWGLVLALWPFVRGRAGWRFAAFALVALAGMEAPGFALLPLVVVVLAHAEAGESGRRRWQSGMPWVALAAILLIAHRASLVFSPVQAVLSLFLVVYPIGLLPGTAQAIEESSTFAVLVVLSVLAVWIALWRVTRHPAVLWCGVAALLLRAFAQPIGLVDLAGGGTMILPIVLVAMGFTAICHRIMQHPAWPRHVVFLTSALCVVFFVLQVQAIQAWRAAALP